MTSWSVVDQAWTVAFFVTTVFSTCLNSLCLYWMKSHWKQTNHDWSVLQVFLADTCLSVASVCLFGWNMVQHGWNHNYGTYMCKTMAITAVWFCCQSVLALMLVACERYSVIVKQRKWSRRRLGIYICSCWLFSAGLSFSQLIFSSVGYEISSAHFFCVARWYGHNGGFIYGWISAVTLITGLSVTACAYYGIWRHVKQSSVHVRRMTNEQDAKRISRDVQLSFRMAILVCVFIVCWSPYLYNFLYQVIRKERSSYELDAVSTWLGYTNSFFNPALYLVLHPQFGRECRSRILSIRQSATMTLSKTNRESSYVKSPEKSPRPLQVSSPKPKDISPQLERKPEDSLSPKAPERVLSLPRPECDHVPGAVTSLSRPDIARSLTENNRAYQWKIHINGHTPPVRSLSISYVDGDLREWIVTEAGVVQVIPSTVPSTVQVIPSTVPSTVQVQSSTVQVKPTLGQPTAQPILSDA
jgi:hypothetical protein